jgi:acetolactate synthase-1/2/3 large subunit
MISQALERIISDKVTAAPIHPGLVAATVRRLTDRHAIIATDVGTHAIWVRDYFHAYEPNTYLETGNYGSMGFALPAAIAAKLVRPEQQVVAVTGDGGFLMSLADLPTAVENRLNIVVVVMNDSKYGMIWRMQEEEYRGRHIGVDLAPSNFASLAQSFGATGVRIDDPRDLAPALREALTDDKMTVIDVLTDHRPDYACREIFKHTPNQAGS